MGVGMFLLSLLLSSSFALEPVRFGPEFTFMADHSLQVSNFPQRAVNHLIHGQPEACRFSVDQGYEGRQRIISPNGWWFCISTDSGGHEVGMSPMTVEEYKRFEADIHDAIFVSAANAGYFPALWQGGGHVNVDITEFRKNPLLLRNFIADMINHGELFLGIFNYDIGNQQPHQTSSSNQRMNVARTLSLPDDPGFEVVVKELFRHVDELLTSGTSEETFERVVGWLKLLDNMGSAFTFRNIGSGRIELRGFRPQASIRVFIHQIELLQKRLEYLEKFEGPIPIHPRMIVPDALGDRLTPPVDPQAALRNFYEYVAESGLRWADHRDYLWPQWQTGGELAFFENSAWFHERESRACERALEE